MLKIFLASIAARFLVTYLVKIGSLSRLSGVYTPWKAFFSFFDFSISVFFCYFYFFFHFFCFCFFIFSFFLTCVFSDSLHSGRSKGYARDGRSRHPPTNQPTKVFEFARSTLRPQRSQSTFQTGQGSANFSRRGGKHASG